MGKWVTPWAELEWKKIGDKQIKISFNTQDSNRVSYCLISFVKGSRGHVDIMNTYLTRLDSIGPDYIGLQEGNWPKQNERNKWATKSGEEPKEEKKMNWTQKVTRRE